MSILLRLKRRFIIALFILKSIINSLILNRLLNIYKIIILKSISLRSYRTTYLKIELILNLLKSIPLK
jgi:hypothetical protein